MQASDPESGDLTKTKTKTGPKTHNWLEAAPKLLKYTKSLLLGWHHPRLKHHHPFGATRHVWCPHDSSHDFTIQDGQPGKDDSCTVMMVIPQGRDSLTFVMVATRTTRSVVLRLVNTVSGAATSTCVFWCQEGRAARALSFPTVFGS